MAETVVCGVDGSEESEAALTVAAKIAERLGTRLLVASVVEHVPASYAAGAGGVIGVVSPGEVMRDVEERRLASRGALETVCRKAGVGQAERRVVTGIVADSLADLADDEEASMIVVGSRGRGALKAAFLGSASSELIGLARCPVLVVTAGARERMAEV